VGVGEGYNDAYDTLLSTELFSSQNELISYFSAKFIKKLPLYNFFGKNQGFI
jgi:hypothetical protein